VKGHEKKKEAGWAEKEEGSSRWTENEEGSSQVRI